eukprot:TRINITY_DN95337_c0_g1_i1.p1 TRINITY_DN95337_c0_g1~~TRINITY_DN95337_c0_g1_i1.p1  ORF type:complete len:537 (+),score=89.62 TRINITY_DN95337_c0_g1_i1:45-1655(+)
MAFRLGLLFLLAGESSCRASEIPPDGDYLIRILFVRHGFSCANVPWNACTKNATQLTPEGMGGLAYNDAVTKLNGLLLPNEPVSMLGMNGSWGLKPRGWPIPGKSKTDDGKSDDCLLKVLNTTLVNDDYNEFGNLVAIRQLVRDPHLTACSQHIASTAAEVLSSWLESEAIKFDLVGSSSLKRAIETVELVYMRNPSKAASKVATIMPLPYLNEKNMGTPFQPENYPYPDGVQEAQMRELLGTNSTPLDSAFASFPQEDQMWDKFKAVLSLNILPSLISGSPTVANLELLAKLEERDIDGHRVFPEQSSWPQIVQQPIEHVDLGSREYVWKAPFEEASYKQLKAGGAKELVIGIGSHSHLLMEHCWHGKSKPNNLAVLEKLLHVKVVASNKVSERGDVVTKTSFEVSEGAEPCRLIMDAPPPPDPGSLTKSDLGANCETPFDVSLFMDLAAEPPVGETSSCMSAKSKRAFTLKPQHPTRLFSKRPRLKHSDMASVTLMAAIAAGAFPGVLVAARRFLWRGSQKHTPLVEGDSEYEQ